MRNCRNLVCPGSQPFYIQAVIDPGFEYKTWNGQVEYVPEMDTTVYTITLPVEAFSTTDFSPLLWDITPIC